MLPLILGILGIFFQVYAGKKGTQQFWVTFLLFFMTGLAIVVYLNQTPFQPRERDYAYAGSFYAFCIWIGIGTVSLINGLKKLKLNETTASIAGVAIALLIPLQMASQTWDDHDRSGRFVARDFGMNYLTTCEPNAIIFTNGDNDTFPLWYAQEVEGYRTDVRVCNLSYLQTDWYIDQMKRQAYESEPLPIDWKKYEYVQGKHDMAYVLDIEHFPWPVDKVLNRIKSDDRRDKQIPQYDVEVDNVPTQKIVVPIDKEAVLASGLVKPENADWIPPHLLVDFSDKPNEKGEPTAAAKRYIVKNEMMILDMLKNNAEWKRPIYFAITVGSDQYMRLESYFRQDGAAYRVMPYEAAKYQAVDTDILYDNVMNKYKWGNLEQPGLYLDENCMRMTRTFRIIFSQLTQRLVDRGDMERAEKAADRCLQVIPSYNVPYDFYSTGELADAYHRMGKEEKANKLYSELADISMRNLNWYNRLNRNQYASVITDIQRDMLFMQSVLYYFAENDTEKFNRYSQKYSDYLQRYQTVTGQQRKGGFNR